jgi:transcriptional regulator with XRE-family HTH domain
VAANVRDMRERRGLTIYELSAALRKCGRPIEPSAVAKIERRQRQVTVDDLMALALALDVTPNRLILPAGAGDDEPVELTSAEQTTAAWAWRWAADGELPLGQWPPTHGKSTIGPAAVERRRRFHQENNPHVPPEPSLEDIAPHIEIIERATQAVTEVARASGISLEHLAQMVKWRAGARLQTDTED